MLEVGWGDVHPGNCLWIQYKRGELFRRYHLQNIDNNAIEESSEGVEGAFVESDNQAGLPVLDEGEVVPVEQRKEKCLPSAIFIDICT